MTQQPHLEKLIQRFAKNRNVIFLSLNFHDSRDAWKKHVTTSKLAGLHWKVAKSEDESRAEKLFALDSFPRFMIVGGKGEILSASAPAPNHPGLPQVIEKALRKYPGNEHGHGQRGHRSLSGVDHNGDQRFFFISSRS